MEINWKRLQDEEYRWGVVDALMRDYGDAITHYCTTWLGEELAEEAAQSVFVSAWEQLPKFRPVAPIHRWLFGIARHQCQQAFRNRDCRRAIDRAFMEDARQRVHATDPDSPEYSMIQATELEWFQASLAKLREEERILLNLRYRQDLSMPAMADVMGKSEAAIRKRLDRAKQRFREIMRDAPKE